MMVDSEEEDLLETRQRSQTISMGQRRKGERGREREMKETSSPPFQGATG